MDTKIESCNQILTSSECKELDQAYDKGISLVEEMIAKQEETIEKLMKAKGREGNWEKLNRETIQT